MAERKKRKKLNAQCFFAKELHTHTHTHTLTGIQKKEVLRKFTKAVWRERRTLLLLLQWNELLWNSIEVFLLFSVFLWVVHLHFNRQRFWISCTMVKTNPWRKNERALTLSHCYMPNSSLPEDEMTALQLLFFLGCSMGSKDCATDANQDNAFEIHTYRAVLCIDCSAHIGKYRRKKKLLRVARFWAFGIFSIIALFFFQIKTTNKTTPRTTEATCTSFTHKSF